MLLKIISCISSAVATAFRDQKSISEDEESFSLRHTIPHMCSKFLDLPGYCSNSYNLTELLTTEISENVKLVLSKPVAPKEPIHCVIQTSDSGWAFLWNAEDKQAVRWRKHRANRRDRRNRDVRGLRSSKQCSPGNSTHTAELNNGPSAGRCLRLRTIDDSIWVCPGGWGL